MMFLPSTRSVNYWDYRDMRDILQGLLIFNKYEPDGYFSAEHDEVMCGSTKTKENATEEELKQLEDLGWRWQEEYECYACFT